MTQLLLLSARFAFLILSNISVYLATSLLLKSDNDEDVGPQDLHTFELIAVIVTIVGLVFSSMFHLGIRERNQELIRQSYINVDDDKNQAAKQETIWSWFKRVDFYTTAISYMCARLVQNLLMVFGPVYVINTLINLPKQWIGYVPLIMYFSGFIMTFLVKWISMYGVKWPYILGSILTIGGTIGVFFLGVGESVVAVIIVFVIFGLGSNALVCSSMELITELIGPNTITGGFVFGIMSLTDKVSNGIVVVIVETFAPCGSYSKDENGNDNCPFEESAQKADYYKTLMSYGLAGIAVFGVIGLLLQLFLLRNKQPDETEILRFYF